MRNNKQCVWSSSYDRGLRYLLSMWPDVLKEVPDAKLIITYGWNLFDAIFEHGRPAYNPERLAWKEKMNEAMNQPGVTHLGRIGQQDMIKLLEHSGIWSYPTNFDEISCISAMKAQIYGAIPVTMSKAALKETVLYGTKLFGDINDLEVFSTYIEELIGWLKDNERQEATRKVMMPQAKLAFSWRGVAEAWKSEFDSPKVYSDEWAKELFESLPEGLKKDEYKPYNL